MNKEFDADFEKCTDLRWYPWVGRGYEKGRPHRLLIVGESHYYDDEPEKIKSFTRTVIRESSSGKKKHRTIDNIWRTCGINDISVASFWESVAFYNFVQSPVQKAIRPTYKQFVESWPAFLKVLSILNPTFCIFIGIEASKSFNKAMDESKYQYTAVSKHGVKIGTSYGRFASVDVGERRIPIISIQHASGRFPWSRWQSFLLEKGAPLLSLASVQR